MILPIVLTGRLGLPAGGVPNFTTDSSGNVVGAEFWPDGTDASGVDPATGEPITAESGAAVPSPIPVNPNVINLQPLRDTGGVTQWMRTGKNSSEPAFDRWRRAGRPTACSLGDWAGTLQAALTAGIVGADASIYPPGTVVQSNAQGISIITPGNVSNPGATIPYVPGTITATASANPLGWILGLGLLGFLFYTVSQR
jgi:hypothetical protein